MKIPSWKDIPGEFQILNWVLQKIESVAALIVVALFGIGVIDLGLLIFERFQSGEIREVSTVIELIEFLLLLFIIVEVYRTIAAYAQDRQPKYVLTLVLYTGVIAVVRRILVFKPEDFASSTDVLFNSMGFAILLLSLGVMIFIVDQYGNPMETVPAIGETDKNNEGSNEENMDEDDTDAEDADTDEADAEDGEEEVESNES
mgnify:CR=1 FL=1